MEHFATQHSLQKAKRTVGRFVALLLVLCFVMPYVAPALPAAAAGESSSKAANSVTSTPSKATATGEACNNTYLLRVSTGANAGTAVKYFAVRYVDSNDVARVEYVLPHGDARKKTLERGLKNSALEKRLNTVENSVGYTLDLDEFKKADALRSNTDDEFLFTPHFTVKEITAVDVYQQYKSGIKGWTCTGLSIYQVTKLYGMDMMGYYSSNLFLDFEGKVLYTFAKSADLTLSNQDKTYRFATTGGNYVLTDGAGKAVSFHDTDEYLFEVDIADVYRAGIEKFFVGSIGYWEDYTWSYRELFDLEVSYTDTSGGSHKVLLPVFTSAAAWGTENGYVHFENGLGYSTLMQQGEQMVFGGKLPNFDKLNSCTLHYTADADEKAGVVQHTDNSDDISDISNTNLTSDTFAVSAFKLYKNVKKDQIQYTGGNNSTQMFYTISADPIYYSLAETNSGITLTAGSSKKLTLHENDGSADLSPNLDGRYVVVIKTDTPAAAGTKDEVRVRFTYQSVDGATKTTKYYSLNTASQDFYGFWPCYNAFEPDDGRVWPNYYRYYGLQPGGEIMFFMDLDDVSTFKSFELAMGSTASDNWQMKSLVIYDPSWIGHRITTNEESVVNDDHSPYGSLWKITRDFDKSAVMCSYGMEINGETPENELPIYIDADEEETSHQTVHFGDEGGEGKDDPDEPETDWNKIKNAMTYKEAMQDFGFNKTRATYEVEVQVAGNDSANDKDGDTGSTNLFYFQLLFKGGSSAYVLANQQLTADGFRAGELETFTISTNQDYGDLTAIRILPDDSDARESTDIFDKLNIQSITVTKKSSAVASTAWNFANVGWIKIDYRDDAPKNTAAGLQGRSAKDLVREFTVTGKGVSTNLMFSITTDAYELDDDSPSWNENLEGIVTASITYTTNDNEEVKKTIDVVQKMYEYNGETPHYESTYGKLSGSIMNENGTEVSCAVSDVNRMFRAGHTDRFFVSLNDVHTIKYMDLSVRGSAGITWTIKDVSVYQLLQNGTLRMNNNDEYQRHTADQLELITSGEESAYEILVPGDGSESGMPINFKDNIIKTEESESGWTSTITREPDNENDTLNVYIYMGEKADDPVEYSGGASKRNYDLKADMYYQDRSANGSSHLALTGMNYDSADKVVYATGINARSFITLQKMKLSVPSLTPVRALVDHAIVQHVRSGVVISTYYMDFCDLTSARAPSNAYSISLERSPDSGLSKSTEQQVVNVMFGKDTVTSGLIAEKADVAVALRYTLKGDPMNKEYNSPYIFLTDVKQKVTTVNENGETVVVETPYASVRAGMIAEIPFEIPNVNEITGVVVASTGNVKVTVDGMTVGCYPITRIKTGSSTTIERGDLTKWYNFAGTVKVGSTPAIMSVTDTNVVPVEITVKTAASTNTTSTSTADPIRMTIGFVSQDGRQTRTMTIDDVRTYMTSGSLEAGKEATFCFFIKNAGDVRYVTIEPHAKATYSQAAWGVDTLKVRTTVNGVERVAERKFTDMIIREGDPRTVNLCNISISTKTSFYNSNLKKSSTVNSDSEGKSAVLVYSGDQVTIRPTLSGSLAGYSYFVSAVKVEGEATAEVNCFKQSDGQIVFETPKNLTAGTETYRVIMESEENEAVKAIVEIRVESEAVATTATTQTTTTTEETSVEETSSTESTTTATESTQETSGSES